MTTCGITYKGCYKTYDVKFDKPYIIFVYKDN